MKRLLKSDVLFFAVAALLIGDLARRLHNHHRTEWKEWSRSKEFANAITNYTTDLPTNVYTINVTNDPGNLILEVTNGEWLEWDHVAIVRLSEEQWQFLKSSYTNRLHSGPMKFYEQQ